MPPRIAYAQGMIRNERPGEIAIIFVSRRTGADEAGYAAAAEAMDQLAAQQPGYRGMESVRGANRLGITISYWADDAAAIAWRDHPDHRAVRDAGRDRWYSDYEIVVAQVTRDYRWARPGAQSTGGAA